MTGPRAAALLVLALGGCAGPQIATAPVAPVTPAAAWRNDAGTAAALDPLWWRGFGDPALAALVDKALANNSDIAIAAALVREARATAQLARAQLLPTLDAGAGAGRSRAVSAS